MSTETFLVMGLGNPGPQYEMTRHNCGYMVLDELARRATPMPATLSTHKKTNTDTATIRLTGPNGTPVNVVLGRSRSFMNLSGGPTAALAKFYGIDPSHIIVAHDELDIDFGVIRLKRGGGEGGHNGLRDISKALGTKDYLRVRVGIGRPPGRMSVTDYVLKPFAKSQDAELTLAIDRAADAVELLIREGLTAAQNVVHAWT